MTTTLERKLKVLFDWKDYDQFEQDELDAKISEIKPNQLSKDFDDSYAIGPLHNVFTKETIGVMLWKRNDPQNSNEVISIEFGEEIPV